VKDIAHYAHTRPRLRQQTRKQGRESSSVQRVLPHSILFWSAKVTGSLVSVKKTGNKKFSGTAEIPGRREPIELRAGPTFTP